ncbi:MAG: hypothetical protein WC809_20980 [Sinimarinibacterium sp.]|jgi:nucleoside-specific outer membrane channel protein Tsx
MSFLRREIRSLGPILLAGAAMVSHAVPCPAADWSDTLLGYRFGTQYREPANDSDIAKSIVTVQHVSGYTYGTNFFNLDLLLSDSADPAADGGGGAAEAYFVYRHGLSLGALLGAPLKLGPVRDLGMTAGLDLNTKNDAFGSRKRKFAIGPTLHFDVADVLNVSLLYQTERNRNGIVGTEVRFRDTYDLNIVWNIPFNVGLPARWKGFVDYIGAKGKDGFGQSTEPETLIETAVLLDIGAIAARKGVLYGGVGYQYWRNKFGNPPSAGTTASVPQLAVEAHF